MGGNGVGVGWGYDWWMDLGWDGDMGLDGGEITMRIRMGNGGGVGRGYGGQSVAGWGGVARMKG